MPPVCMFTKYYCRTHIKAVRGVKRGDVCYGMLRAAACVDESDHHALIGPGLFWTLEPEIDRGNH